MSARGEGDSEVEREGGSENNFRPVALSSLVFLGGGGGGFSFAD